MIPQLGLSGKKQILMYYFQAQKMEDYFNTQCLMHFVQLITLTHTVWDIVAEDLLVKQGPIILKMVFLVMRKKQKVPLGDFHRLQDIFPPEVMLE